MQPLNEAEIAAYRYGELSAQDAEKLKRAELGQSPRQEEWR
jgi:hypothetical protein